MSMNRSEHIRVYCTGETKQKIKEQAEREGLKPSSWLRRIAKKELPEKVNA